MANSSNSVRNATPPASPSPAKPHPRKRASSAASATLSASRGKIKGDALDLKIHGILCDVHGGFPYRRHSADSVMILIHSEPTKTHSLERPVCCTLLAS